MDSGADEKALAELEDEDAPMAFLDMLVLGEVYYSRPLLALQKLLCLRMSKFWFFPFVTVGGSDAKGSISL